MYGPPLFLACTCTSIIIVFITSFFSCIQFFVLVLIFCCYCAVMWIATVVLFLLSSTGGASMGDAIVLILSNLIPL